MAAPRWRALVMAGLVLVCGSPSAAQDYALPAHLVAGGGSASAGGTWVLVASVGQPAAPGDVSFGAANALRAGFWHAASASTPAPFVDPALTPGASLIRLIHVAELRQRIDALRIRHGLPPFAWTDPSLVAGVTFVRAVHFTDLRDALAQAYSAVNLTPPPYTGTILAGAPVTAAVIAELRTVVAALE